jgi:ribosomal protein S18
VVVVHHDEHKKQIAPSGSATAMIAARRVLLSPWTHHARLATNRLAILRPAVQASPSTAAVRFFSKKKDENEGKSKGETDDPFGVHFEDGTDHGKLGPSIPPKYKRDKMTGKFTGEKETELSDKDTELIKMDSIQEQDYLLERFLEDWDLSDKDETGDSTRQAKLARRIQQDNMGLNVLGRSVESQKIKNKFDDGEEGYKDPSGFSKPLSPAEFRVLQKHMQDEYKADVTDEEIPVEYTGNDDDAEDSVADDDYLATKWLSSRAVRFMDSTKDDDPFSDLMPSDLSPSLLVNRKKAKPIPKHLLHHNNLALLRRYVSPTGQIMSRIHSRLGAKDQRKISKLIKKARNLGLLPHQGQFAVEVHGSIYEEDIAEDKVWEKELVRRGLVVGGDKRIKKGD